MSNEPEKLVHTALDTLAQTLNIECCWIQTISDRQNQKLLLAADRGFTDSMKREITAMNLKHDFCGEIIGKGNRITIPNLYHDGVYGLSSFRDAGYRWLVAVPLLTYRVYGLLGAACRSKKNFDNKITDLIMVIAGMIANALSKAELARNFPPPAKPRIPLAKLAEARVARDVLMARITQKPARATLPPVTRQPVPMPDAGTEPVPAATLTISRPPDSTPPRPSTLPGIPLEDKKITALLDKLKTLRETYATAPPRPGILPDNKTETLSGASQKASRALPTPPHVPLPEAGIETVSTATLTISSVSDSPPPLPSDALPENKIKTAPVAPQKASCTLTVPPRPPERTIKPAPEKKTTKQPSLAFSSHPRKKISFREAHRKS